MHEFEDTDTMLSEINNWNQFFKNRFNIIYGSVFLKYGISRDAAFIGYMLNRVGNDIVSELVESTEDNNEE